MQNFNLKTIYDELDSDLSNEFQFNRTRLEHIKTLDYDTLTVSEQNAKIVQSVCEKMQKNNFNFSVVELQHINKTIDFLLQ